MAVEVDQFSGSSAVSDLRAVSSDAVSDDVVVPLRSGGRRRRVGLAALGALFVVLAALAGALLFQSLRSSVSVLVLATDVEAGEVLAAEALVVAEVGADGLGQLSYLPVERQGEVVGLTALGPLPAGSLVSSDMFGSRGEVIPAGESVVGVVLDRGALPAGLVQSGDEVDLIAVADGSGVVAAEDGSREAVVLVRARVWLVEPSVEFEQGTSVSFVVPSDSAPVVAQAAADGLLRVGLVGQ